MLHEQIKGICKSKGGLRMELMPIRLHTRPSSVATFTCSYRAHVPLNITFHMLGLSNPAKVMEMVSSLEALVPVYMSVFLTQQDGSMANPVQF